MAVAVPYIMIAAAAAASYSAYQSGQTQSKMAKYNANLALMQADQERAAGAANAADAQYKAGLLLGSQRAAAAASGADPNEGSPLNLMTDTASRTTLDALRIKYGGDTKGTFLQNDAAGGNYLAGRYAAAGTIGAGSSLLNGLALYGNRYGTPQQNPQAGNGTGGF